MAQLKEVSDSKSLAKAVLTTVYMGTVNSSDTTRQRAQALADEIGADHLDVKIDQAVDAMAKLFAFITGRTPKFKVRLHILANHTQQTRPHASSEGKVCALKGPSKT